ncbi:hypothetical protein GK047_01275 [Paenibacillus sp. SYP-B3998]|uniref:Uncharacterized protein n=1 Tax=Paenibacillus sp. SYP-B3998 TaxID=2678564 RepID=A0A6G3ZSH1_9BACL|nr:hypothetical protein [Paenibacillus sp. SYP-B3998]NEW04654.1 hypothetical protein [Paenibacillus sp. SYP-B3998]
MTGLKMCLLIFSLHNINPFVFFLGLWFITLEELAVPFSNNLIEHLKLNDKQTTSQSSTMLNACRQFIAGEIL